MLEKENKLKLSEIIDIKFLQEFQDVFAKTTDVASIIVDDFGPVTEPSNFTDFCIKHTRGSSLGFKRCNECDIRCGKTAALTHEPVIYTCHTGLTDFAVPIIVNGEHIGSILGGQVLTEQPDEDHYRAIARDLGIDEDEYIVALRKIKIVPLERVKAAADLLYFVAKTISNNSLKNLELMKKNELESLYRKITEKIRSSLDTEQTLTFICEEVAKLFNIQRATVVQFPDPQNYENYKVKLEYKTDLEINGLTSPVYQQEAAAYWGRSLGNGVKIIAFDNIQESDTPDYFRECYTALGVKSMIGFPIKKENTPWGSLVLSEYNNYRHWSDEEKTLLETISDQMYIAINQSELYEAVQKTAENERVLRKIMLSSVKTFDFQERVKAIVDEVGEFYKADRCFFVGYDLDIASDSEIRTYAEYLSSEEIQSQLTNRPDKATIERLVQLLKLRNVLAVENVEEASMLDSAKQMLKKLSVKSYLVAPVFYGDINYGAVVWHYVHDFKEFSQEDIAMAQAIANQSAVVINQTQLYSTIEKNEKYTRTIMDSIKDGIITINDDFVVESCNPSVEAIWGYSMEEVVGQKLDLLLHHDCINTDKKICLSGKTYLGVKKTGKNFRLKLT